MKFSIILFCVAIQVFSFHWAVPMCVQVRQEIQAELAHVKIVANRVAKVEEAANTGKDVLRP